MTRTHVDPATQVDIEKFERLLADHLAGRMDEDAFRVFRLNNGVYGQRQGGHNQLLRVKAPFGALNAAQLDALGDIADTYSRGRGHLTTRQAVQFHFVQLERVPSMLRDLARVGLTTREACGDAVRNVMGCHLAGACPSEELDISAWAQATFALLLRHPYSQRLPRKFKINFSGCALDCGQALFNDVGVVAVSRQIEDGTRERGFRVYIAGGLGANPHTAQVLEDFTTRENLLATIEAVLRTFDHYGNRANNRRARLKWLVDELGVDEVRRRVLRERQLLVASSSWPGGVPAIVVERGDARAGVAKSVAVSRVGTPVAIHARPGSSPFQRWCDANLVTGVADGRVAAIVRVPLGDLSSAQFRALAAIVRDFEVELRTTNRQNLALRRLKREDVPEFFTRIQAIGLAEPSAELARDIVSCPGADTCNLALTRSRELATEISRALEAAGLGDVGGVRINVSGCTNSCGQHHVADIGLHGVERRAHGRAAPGYQLLLGGHIGDGGIDFAKRALRLPARAVAEAVVRLVGRYADERRVEEPFADWIERTGGVDAVVVDLKELDEWPHPDDRPDYYVDFGEDAPYVAEVGEGECAAV